MAVLFYNTGPGSNQDFVALEIWKGRPRLLVDQVSGEPKAYIKLSGWGNF